MTVGVAALHEIAQCATQVSMISVSPNEAMRTGKIASLFKFQNVRLPSKSVARREHQHTARHSNSGTHRSRSKHM